jgi:hypothetical protein
MDEQYESLRIQQKESVYRKLYSSILQERRGVLQASNTNNDSDTTKSSVFDDEQQCLSQIVRTEVKNLLVGVGVTAAVLVSLRLGSKHVLSTMFGEAKSKAFKEAEIDARRRGTEGFQKSLGRKMRNILLV